MQMLRNRSHFIRALLLLGTALLLGGCNSEDGDDGNQPTSSSTGGQNQAALVGLPTRSAVTQTDRFLDLAINGEGMFVLTDPRSTETVYSRYGRFDIDSSGALIDSEGRRLMGQATTATAATSAPLATVLPPIPRLLAPKASSRIQLEFNLDSRLSGPNSALVFDPQDPRTYNNATSVTVYDAKGQALALTLYFRKSDTIDDSWDAYMTVNGQALPAGEAPVIAGMQFTADGGRLIAPIGLLSISIPAGMPLTSGGTGMQVNLQLDLGRATQYGASFSITDLSQDGYAAGQLGSISFSERGFITAYYQDGQVRSAGQVLLAKFTVADRFGLVGEHGYSCRKSCTQPIIEVPGVLLLGTLLPGSLEPR